MLREQLAMVFALDADGGHFWVGMASSLHASDALILLLCSLVHSMENL